MLAAALACCLFPAIAMGGEGAAAAPDATTGEVYLEVLLNQAQKPSLYRFVVRGGRLYASAATLHELGLRGAGEDAGNTLLPVDRGGVVVAYDAANQRVAITAPLSQMTLATTRIDARMQPLEPSTTPPGALFTYDADAIRDGRNSNVVVSPLLKLFGPGRATLEANGIIQATSVGKGWHSRAVRLDTRARWTFPGSALEIVAGDSVTTGPDWTRSTRMGGIRVGTNYASLQPYRALSPGPVFSGESAVPSNVELYVNGIRQYAGETPVGRFVVNGAPSMEGLGTAQLVVTDAFGRSRTIDIPFYGSQRLLAPGLDDWSVALGRVRLDYGTHSAHYAADNALDASWRRGLTPWFTGEFHVEATRGLRQGGAGGSWLLGRAGVAHVAWAASASGALRGSQAAWGYQWSNSRISFAVDSIRSHGDYRDLAAVASGSAPPRVTESANAGVSLPAFGNVNLTFAHLRYDGQSPSRLLGLYWSRAAGRRWFVNAGGNIDLERHGQRSFSLGLTVLLDGQRQGSATVQRSRGRTLSEMNLQNIARVNGDIGWRLQARHDTPGGTGGLAEATWLTEIAQLTAGIATNEDRTQSHLAASGSVLWMGRSLFASRQVTDGFALVDTGYPGVPVKLENRPYGLTNARGQIILTPLFPFQQNHVSIDPTGLPADVRVPARDRIVVPGASGAARVSFELARVRAAVIVLQDASGRILPMGSEVHRAGSAEDGEVGIVGYDGEVYLEALAATNVLEIDTPAGRCTARFDYATRGDDVPRIGPVACVAGGAR